MALDIKKVIINALFTINKSKSLEHITIKDLLNETGLSRQTFYNHFLDKNDLIQYIYNNMIVSNFKDYHDDFNFYQEMIICLTNMTNYQKFLKEACMMEGQNNLKDYIFDHCFEFDMKWHTYLYGKELPDNIKFATKYHAIASSSMTLSWILSDMISPVEEMAAMITQMRSFGMDILLGDKNPYYIDKNK